MADGKFSAVDYETWYLCNHFNIVGLHTRVQGDAHSLVLGYVELQHAVELIF